MNIRPASFLPCSSVDLFLVFITFQQAHYAVWDFLIGRALTACSSIVCPIFQRAHTKLGAQQECGGFVTFKDTHHYGLHTRFQVSPQYSVALCSKLIFVSQVIWKRLPL